MLHKGLTKKSTDPTNHGVKAPSDRVNDDATRSGVAAPVKVPGPRTA